MSDTDTLSTTAPEALALRMLADSLAEHADRQLFNSPMVADDLRDASRALTEWAGQI